MSEFIKLKNKFPWNDEEGFFYRKVGDGVYDVYSVVEFSSLDPKKEYSYAGSFGVVDLNRIKREVKQTCVDDYCRFYRLKWTDLSEELLVIEAVWLDGVGGTIHIGSFTGNDTAEIARSCEKALEKYGAILLPQ